MTWLPYAAKRTAYVERLTKLGTTLPGEGDARYYSFQSYTVSEGMELHGTLGDIFKDAPKRPGAQQSKGVEKPAASKRARSSRLLDIFSAAKKSSEEQSKSKEQNSEIASMAAELRHCQAQLAQLIELAKQKETVQVNPNTTMGFVLDEVCKRRKLNPSEHSLKHQRNVLDSSLTVRFSGLSWQ